MLNESWATLWEALADDQPDHVAVVIGDTHIRWRELDARAARLASVLDSNEVGLDAKVGQLMFNCPEYLESAYASFKVRASTVNVNYRYRAPEIVHVLSDSGASALVYHAAFRDVVAEARRSLPSLGLLLEVADGTEGPMLDGAVDYESAISAASPMEIGRAHV